MLINSFIFNGLDEILTKYCKSDTALIISSISAEQGLMVQASNDTIFPFDDVDIRVKVVIDDVLMKNYHNKVTIEFNNHVDREILTVYGYVN